MGRESQAPGPEGGTFASMSRTEARPGGGGGGGETVPIWPTQPTTGASTSTRTIELALGKIAVLAGHTGTRTRTAYCQADQFTGRSWWVVIHLDWGGTRQAQSTWLLTALAIARAITSTTPHLHRSSGKLDRDPSSKIPKLHLRPSSPLLLQQAMETAGCEYCSS